MTENTETGFTFDVHANNPKELRDVLLSACDTVTLMFDTVNKAVNEREQREKAFIRYCFTGKFD